MSTNISDIKSLENSTLPVSYSSNTAQTAGAITGVLVAAFVITLLVCKYKPGYSVCLRPTDQDQRRLSNVGLTNVNEEETENITNILETDIHVEDDYFYDEVFERSAFTDEMTYNSITNLFTITDSEDKDHPHPINNHERGHI